MRIDTRWATANADDIRKHAAELAALAPDVILANLCPRGAGALLVGTGARPAAGKIIAFPKVGGLHHRYERRAA